MPKEHWNSLTDTNRYCIRIEIVEELNNWVRLSNKCTQSRQSKKSNLKFVFDLTFQLFWFERHYSVIGIKCYKSIILIKKKRCGMIDNWKKILKRDQLAYKRIACMAFTNDQSPNRIASVIVPQMKCKTLQTRIISVQNYGRCTNMYHSNQRQPLNYRLLILNRQNVASFNLLVGTQSSSFFLK